MRWELLTEKKFKTQLFLVLFLMGALVIAGSLVYVSYQKNLTRERSQQTISAITSLKVTQLVQWNEERLSEVTFFSTSQPVLRFALPVIAGDKDKEPMLRKTLQHILSNNRYDDIAILDKNGKLLFSVALKKHPIDPNNKEILERVLQTKKVAFRDFYLSPIEGKSMAFYLAPVLNDRSVVVAYMIFMIDSYDFIYPYIKKWPVPSSTAASYLVEKASNAINLLSPLPGLKQHRIPCRINRDSLDDIALSVLSGKEGFSEGKDAQGVEVLAFSQRVPGTEWILISKVSKSELFADYYHIQGLVFLFGITFFLLLWGGIVWVYRNRQQRMYEELYRKSVDLHHSQEEFGATLYSIGDGVIATDEKGIVTRVNMVASTMTGWSETEAIGKPIEEIFLILNEETRLPGVNPVRLVLQQGGKEGVIRSITSLFVSRDGRIATISDSCSPIKGPDGKVYGVVLVIRDQTEEQTSKRLVEARLSLFEYAIQHDLKESLAFMMKKTGELFNSPLCLLLVVTTKKGERNLQPVLESDNQRVTENPALFNLKTHSLWTRCLDTLLPAVFDDKHTESLRTSAIKNALVVPVLRDNVPVALLGLANRPGGYETAIVQHISYLADVVWEIINEKQKESFLLESEDKYRRLVNQMQIGLALHELIMENGVPVNYRFLEVNPSFEKLTGFTRKQLIGKTVLEVMPDTEPFWIEKYGRVVLDGKPDVFENYASALGKYFSVIAYPISSMKFATIIDDVTEQRRMIDALRSSEQSYRELIDNINDTVWIMETDGSLIDVNKEVIRQLGYSKEEILQIGLNGIDAKMSTDEMEIMIAAVASGVSHIFETIHRTKTGQLIPVEVNAGRVNYMGKLMAVCIARDITQRKRAEAFQHLLYEIASFSTGSGTLDALLVLVRNELDKVMNANNFYVALYQEVTNSLDELVFVNEKFTAHSWPVEGTLSGHVLKTGKSLLLCGDEQREFMRMNNIEVVENPPSCWLGVPLLLSDDRMAIGVLVLQHYSDSHAYDNSNLQILEMVAHELSVVIQHQRIINDLIKAKEKAEESDRLKTAFLANVSHEIRTPMNGILGFIEMLGDSETEPKERVEYLEIVNKCGQRLLATIDDIIEISRIEAGLIELHPSETDLAETMHFLHSFFQPIAQEKGIDLIVEDYVKGKQAIVTIDKFKLDGILTNLLNNAVKFTHTGRILFGNSLQGDDILFYVKDTGIGIPLDRQDAIFQRFVQADLTSTRPYEGSGLGLSIIKAYLDKMGGRIWVDSVPNKGSTFYFTLPYKPVVVLPHPKREEAPVHVNTGTVTILVAEDDPISFIYLETLLKREGYNVYHAKNGLEAVKLAKLHPALDAILMDLKMPEMNGLEATRLIRQFNQTVPIIAQTAFAFTDDKENAMVAGCTDFLTKPTSREQLLLSLQLHVTRLKKDTLKTDTKK